MCCGYVNVFSAGWGLCDSLSDLPKPTCCAIL